jgi:hypothetical protein
MKRSVLVLSYLSLIGLWLGFSGTVGATLIPFTGDFNGDGFDEIGVYRTTKPYGYEIRDIPKLDNYTGYQRSMNTGMSTTQPLVHDVNCDGRDDLVLFTPSFGFVSLDVNTGGILAVKGTGGSSTDVGHVTSSVVYSGCVSYFVTTQSSGTTLYDAQSNDSFFLEGGPYTNNVTYWNGWIYSHYNWSRYVYGSFFWGYPGTTWGITGDQVFMKHGSPSQFIYRPSQLRWYYRTGMSSSTSWWGNYGVAGDIPLIGFFAGPHAGSSAPPVSNNETVVMFRPSTNRWYLREVGQSYTRTTIVHP